MTFFILAWEFLKNNQMMTHWTTSCKSAKSKSEFINLEAIRNRSLSIPKSLNLGNLNLFMDGSSPFSTCRPLNKYLDF